MQLAGYHIMVCPAIGSVSCWRRHFAEGVGRKVYLNFRNNLVMLAKNMPLARKIWKILVRIVLDSVSAWKGLLSGDDEFFYRRSLGRILRYIAD